MRVAGHGHIGAQQLAWLARELEGTEALGADASDVLDALVTAVTPHTAHIRPHANPDSSLEPLTPFRLTLTTKHFAKWSPPITQTSPFTTCHLTSTPCALHPALIISDLNVELLPRIHPPTTHHRRLTIHSSYPLSLRSSPRGSSDQPPPDPHHRPPATLCYHPHHTAHDLFPISRPVHQFWVCLTSALASTHMGMLLASMVECPRCSLHLEGEKASAACYCFWQGRR